MKYLKKYKIFESINKQEIHETCKKYGISNYTINEDLAIDVEAFYEEMELEMNIDFREVKKYYKIIK